MLIADYYITLSLLPYITCDKRHICLFGCSSYYKIWYLLMFYSICKEFEGIKQRALKVPEDTLEMTDMMKFIKDAKTARLVKLNEQIKASLHECFR